MAEYEPHAVGVFAYGDYYDYTPRTAKTKRVELTKEVKLTEEEKQKARDRYVDELMERLEKKVEERARIRLIRQEECMDMFFTHECGGNCKKCHSKP